MVTIEFEDRGQDFTRWTCDETGKVIECAPFQGWLWEGVTVLSPEALKRGEPVDFVNHEGHVRTLAYRVRSVKVH